MLTIFANLRINDLERLQHMKDSLLSFKDIACDDWLINVRGTYRLEALNFLKEHLGELATFFELLDDERGWITNALDMLPAAKYDYVLLWVEDHLNLAPLEIYPKIIREMTQTQADYLMYSWWLFGQARQGFDELELEKGETIDTIELTAKKWKKVLKAGYKNYLVSAVGIFKKSFFQKLLMKDRWMLPMLLAKNIYRILVVLTYLGLTFNRKNAFHWINKIFFANKLPRFPKETPFNLEKGPWRTDILPIKVALPRQELFACIDDDLGYPGYQLVKRGIYPINPELNPESDEGLIEQNKQYEITRRKLRENQQYHKIYYEDENRPQNPLRKTIILLDGEMKVNLKNRSVKLNSGQILNIHPNLNYTFIATQDCDFVEVYTTLLGKNIKYIKS